MVYFEFKPNNPVIHKSVILWDACGLKSDLVHARRHEAGDIPNFFLKERRSPDRQSLSFLPAARL
jgi:hypothetical protein